MNKKKHHTPPPPRRSPWIWLVGGLALLLIGAGVFLLGGGGDPDFVPEVTGAPKLVVDQAVSDAGPVSYGTPVEAAFRLKNVGDEPLRILNEPQVELIEGC